MIPDPDERLARANRDANIIMALGLVAAIGAALTPFVAIVGAIWWALS